VVLLLSVLLAVDDPLELPVLLEVLEVELLRESGVEVGVEFTLLVDELLPIGSVFLGEKIQNPKATKATVTSPAINAGFRHCPPPSSSSS